MDSAMSGDDPEKAFRQTGWHGLRARLFHLYFLMRRPTTPGVRGLVDDENGNSSILITGAPRLVSIHHNSRASRRDHVGLYVIDEFRQTAPKKPDREIAEAGFFRLDNLPQGVTPATLRRIREVFEQASVSPHW